MKETSKTAMLRHFQRSSLFGTSSAYKGVACSYYQTRRGQALARQEEHKLGEYHANEIFLHIFSVEVEVVVLNLANLFKRNSQNSLFTLRTTSTDLRLPLMTKQAVNLSSFKRLFSK